MVKRCLAAALLALAVCAALSGCARQAPTGSQARVTLDGVPWTGEALPGGEGDLRVIITLDGETLIDLPFSRARTVSVVQPDGSENNITLTGDAVYMQSANCENQDCVGMGAVTRDNLELRVMGGFIICLPHRLSVEVRGE